MPAGRGTNTPVPHPDLPEGNIRRLRAQHQPAPSTPLPARQRASDDSLRQHLERDNRRDRELPDENRRLRRQLACALGQLRADTGRHPPLVGYSSKRPKCPYSEAWLRGSASSADYSEVAS
jgi:hypothetical protein